MSADIRRSGPGQSARRRTGWSWRVLASVSALVVALGCAAPAGAARRHFPVPSCGWAKKAGIGKTFGLDIRALKGQWTTQIAPVLTCGFVEVHPNFQAPGAPIITIQFRELQRFQTKGFTYVRGLGSCVEHSSCPRPHKAAWQVVDQVNSSPNYSFPFVAGVQLRVEDGLNAMVVQVTNPDGPLGISDEVGAAKALARRLLPRFYWK